MKTALFSSPERVKLLTYVLNNPGSAAPVRALAKELGLSPAFTSVFLRKIREEGLISKKTSIPGPKARALKVLINVSMLLDTGAIKTVKRLMPQAKSIGIYGSWAKGLNHADSDIDMWVRADDAGEKSLLKLRAMLKGKLKVEPNILLVSEKKLGELREKDSVFYYALVNSFVLDGEGLD